MASRCPSTLLAFFEVDSDGKIAAWRDYLDSKEVAIKGGDEVSSARARSV
jgi:limonene-1,2-epoxide hydrolase